MNPCETWTRVVVGARGEGLATALLGLLPGPAGVQLSWPLFLWPQPLCLPFLAVGSETTVAQSWGAGRRSVSSPRRSLGASQAHLGRLTFAESL